MIVTQNDYTMWRSAFKDNLKNGTIQVSFDLPPKSTKVQKSESSVIFLFGQVHQILGMSEVQFANEFPDCTALWQGSKVSIEFEYDNADFNEDHKRQEKPTNLLIICWENRWRRCPYPVLELKRIYLN